MKMLSRNQISILSRITSIFKTFILDYSFFKLTFLIGFIFLSSNHLFSQIIFTESGTNTLASIGWSGTNNNTSQPLEKGSYYLVEFGNPADEIITASYDLSANSSATYDVDIRSYGSGTHRKLKIEVSLDGGTTYTQTYLTNVTTTDYVTQSIVIPTVSSQLVIRMVHNNTSGRGIRLRNMILTGVGSTGPTISVSPSSLTGFTYVEGSGPSAEQSFTVEGSNLTNDIDVTPSSDWEISLTTGSAFSATNPITLSQSGGTVATTTIYTRMKASLLAVNSPFSGNIACSSTGATTENVAVDGIVIAPCATPLTQPTVLTFPSTTENSIDGSFAAASPVADGYLVVQSTNSSLSSNPADGTTYVAGDPLGGGTVVQASSATTFTNGNLSPNTTYYYFIFSYNNVNCVGGPMYLTASPLSGNETTLNGPCVSENFDTFTGGAPTGWTGAGCENYSSTGSSGNSPNSVKFDGTNDYLVTPNFGGPAESLSFWLKGNGTNSSSSALLVEGFDGTSWVTIENITNIVSNAPTTYFYDASSSPALPASISQFRFTYTKVSGNVAFDDVEVMCVSGCNPTHTIVSFDPISGPVGTEITISGTGFTPSSTVKINGFTATVLSQTATELIVEVLSGTTTGTLSVIENGCPVDATDFTVTTSSGSCFSGNGFSDIYISEIFDSEAGDLGFIELYNPSNTAIDLNAAGTDFEINIDNRDALDTGVTIDQTIDLTGIIPANSTFIIQLGTTGSPCAPSVDLTGVFSGINADDYVFLTKNGSDTDRLNCPPELGFTMERNGNAVGPTTTFNAADWSTQSTESCAGLGYSTLTTPILSELLDQNVCNPTFSISATPVSGGVLTYIWYFYNGSVWQVVNSTNLPGYVIIGETTSSLVLSSGSALMSDLNGYQFYVEVTEDASCTSVSNAASYIDPGNCDNCTQLFISEYGEPNSGDGKYIEIYNPTTNSIDLSNYQVWKIANGGVWQEASVDLVGTLLPFEVFVIANNAADVPGADLYHIATMNFNGNDAVGLAYNGGSGSAFSLIDAIGTEGPAPSNGWDVAGVSSATKNHTLIRKASVQGPTTNWVLSAGTNATDSQWLVMDYGQAALGMHTGDCGTNSNTIVSFQTPPTITANENDGTVTFDVTIYNADPSNATTVDVVLISGNPLDLGGYTTQTVIFPAGSSANQTVTVTITDNFICDGNRYYQFALQNASGGNNAMVGAYPTFLLEILDEELGYDVILNDNFDDGDISNWIQTGVGDWEAYDGTSVTPFAAPLNGSHSLRNIADANGTGEMAIAYLYDDCLVGVNTTWRFQTYFGYEPSTNNYFLVYLTNKTAGNEGTGYAIGVFPQMDGDDDIIELYKMQDGLIVQTIISTGVSWTANNTTNPPGPVVEDRAGFEITRDKNGLWEVKLDIDGGFDNLISFGTPAINTDYGFTEKFEIFHRATSGGVGQLMLDDIYISQENCSEIYYSQASGNVSDPIWADQPTGGVPQSIVAGRFTELVIQDGHVVTLDQELHCKNMAIASTATLDAQDKFLCLSGDFINQGTFIPGTSYVSFNGKGQPQIVDATTTLSFYDIALDNPDGVNTPFDLQIINGVFPEEGVFDFTAADITLKSDPSGTASIGEIKTGADVIGQVKMERYIQPDDGTDLIYPGGWIGISTALLNQTVADWDAFWDNSGISINPADSGLITTGFPGSDYPNYAYPDGTLFNNIIKWNEVSGSWDKASSLSDPISGEGYYVYMLPIAQNVHMRGEFLKGTQSTPLSYTTTGWNLITNPYPCPVDWDKVFAASTNVDPTYYIYNSDNGSFLSFNTNTQSGLLTNRIAASQSFWVKALAAGAQINWEEKYKIVDATDQWERLNYIGNGFSIILSQDEVVDKCLVGFHDEATTNYDPDLDSPKLNIPMPHAQGAFISTLSVDDIALQNNQVEPNFDQLDIPIHIENYSMNQEYNLSISGGQNLDQYCVILEDLLLNTFTLVDQSFQYNFEVLGDDDTRFVLHIYNNHQPCDETQVTSINDLSVYKTSIYANEDELIISSQSNVDQVDVMIYNSLGQKVISKRVELTNGIGRMPLASVSGGIYLVQISNHKKLLFSGKLMR